MIRDDLPAPPAPSLPPSLRARVMEDAPRAAAKLPRPLGLGAVVAVGGGWLALFAVHHGRRANWDALPPVATWGALAAMAVFAALAGAVAFSRGPILVGPATRRLLGSLMVPALIAAMIVPFVPNTTPSAPDAFVASAVACAVGVVVAALPLLVALVVGLRGRVLASPGLVGAAAGVSAAAAGHLVLHWCCPWTDAGHALWGHVAPSLPLAVAGALFARWVLRTRPVGA